MKFSESHLEFFDTKSGAFSIVTERENFDSQITITKEEKEIILNYFGSESIHRGNKSSDPIGSLKEFLLYPEMDPIKLNLVYPKTEKSELRLYLSKESGFKPNATDIWFTYINNDNQLVIGSYPQHIWSEVGAEINQHSFEPGAMSIIQMGEELIGHPSTAINELVKNSYDADATSCKIYFNVDKDNNDNSFALIYDNGSGMDDTVLFGDWLKPSISSKRKEKAKSELYDRNLLGKKGIGRLAAMALGESVTVISRMEKSEPFNWITVNRALFREDRLLSEVKFPGDKINSYTSLFYEKFYYNQRTGFKNSSLTEVLKTNNLQSFKKGTLIIIERLDNSVIKQLYEDFAPKTLFIEDKDQFINASLYKSLSTLITPFKIGNEIYNELAEKSIIKNNILNLSKENLFNIYFSTNLIPKTNFPVIEWISVESLSVQKTFDYRLYGKVEKNGNVHAHYSVRRIENKFVEETIEIARDEIFDDSLSGKKEQNLFTSTNENEAGEYYFDIRVYDIGEKDNLEKLAKQSKFETGSKFKSAFKNLQGLRVSKNGFGVKPYGEEVEDWIGLSKERVQNPGQNISTNQIIGYLYFFSPENDALEEKTNREGFIENSAFNQVKTTISALFKDLGRRRYNYRLANGLGRIPNSKHKRPDFEEFLDKLKSCQYADERFINYSERFMKEVNTSMDNLEESLSFAERLASLGSGIELVYHEMAQPIAGLRLTKSSLSMIAKKVDPSDLDFFIDDINGLTHSTDVLAELRESLQPAIGRSRIKIFSPYVTFAKVVNLFKSDIEDLDIKITIDDRIKDYTIECFEYAFWISFLNIINNAIYWIKKAHSNCEIRFYLSGDRLIISNNGPMIREDIIDHIFKYGVTARTEKNATGLGLAFTQSILSRNDWEITAENSDFGPKFTIYKSNKNE